MGLTNDVYILKRGAGASSGGAAWGDIIGTIGDQTDLAAEFATKADLAGAIFTGDVWVDGTDSAAIKRFVLNNADEIAKILSFRSNDLARWALRVDGTESTGNAGSDMAIRRYGDDGLFIDAPISILRSTGLVNILKLALNGTEITATATELNYVDGVTSPIQAQIDAISGGGGGGFMLITADSIADCDNTSSEVTILQFTIPANTWEDGEMLLATLRRNSLQNSGGAVNLTTKLDISANNVYNTTASVANSTNIGDNYTGFALIRRGNNILIYNGFTYMQIWMGSNMLTSPTATNDTIVADNTVNTTAANSNYTNWTGYNFASNIVIALKMQWAAANVNTYVRNSEVLIKKEIKA